MRAGMQQQVKCEGRLLFVTLLPVAVKNVRTESVSRSLQGADGHVLYRSFLAVGR